MSVTAMSRVATERGERYRKQLASHFDNKIEVAEEPWSLPGSSLAAPGRPGAGAMLDRMTTAPEHPEHSEHDQHDDKHRLTAVQGLAALSLDALSSVAYGPEAILVV